MSYKNDTGLISVTELLQPYIDTRYFLETHTELGSAVHEYIGAHVNQCPWMPTMPDDIAGYVASAKKFVEKYVENIFFAEKRLTDYDLRYCGQVDLVFAGKDKKIWLVDWKKSVAKQNWWPLQLAGYSLLARKEKITADNVCSVRLRSNGGLPLVDFYNDRIDYYDNIFIGILNAYNFFE